MGPEKKWEIIWKRASLPEGDCKPEIRGDAAVRKIVEKIGYNLTKQVRLTTKINANYSEDDIAQSQGEERNIDEFNV